MAGSYRHVVDDAGRLLGPEYVAGTLENDGDVYEAVEQMYGMIWYLADGDPAKVERAERYYRWGLGLSPGSAAE